MQSGLSIAVNGLHAAVPAPAQAAPLSARLRRIERVPDALKPAWQALADAASEPNSFAESWFVEASLQAFAADAEVYLFEAWRGAELVGLLPVALAREYGRLPVTFTQNWRHDHQFLGAPLIRAGEEQGFWSLLLTALDEAHWARGFFHARGLVENGPVHRGLVTAAQALGRPADIVYREVRALLESDLSPQAYYEASVRKKKRKEHARLRNRLEELGTLSAAVLTRADQIEPWCDAFLALERSGWKGRAGSALGSRPQTDLLFRSAVRGAFDAAKLHLLRLDLDGRPIAMLVNFLSPPGSFSFKTAYDETYARFSPGVLVQMENLSILSRPDIGWMDSCAAEDHPMIDSIWRERRSVVRVTVPLSGARRRLVHGACRGFERLGALRRRLRTNSPTEVS